MFHRLLHTDFDRTLTFLRLVLGAVFFAHGAQKMLGWYGGAGFDATMSIFTEGMSIPAPLAFLAIATEFFGSLALILGLLGRVAGVAILVEMIVAVFLVHLPFGFFMNWTGIQAGEGFEYHLLAIAIALPIAVKGAGAWSLDHALDKRLGRPTVAYPEGRWRKAHAH